MTWYSGNLLAGVAQAARPSASSLRKSPWRVLGHRTREVTQTFFPESSLPSFMVRKWSLEVSEEALEVGPTFC